MSDTRYPEEAYAYNLDDDVDLDLSKLTSLQRDYVRLKETSRSLRLMGRIEEALHIEGMLEVIYESLGGLKW